MSFDDEIPHDVNVQKLRYASGIEICEAVSINLDFNMSPAEIQRPGRSALRKPQLQ
jgi:hypothetical protein